MKQQSGGDGGVAVGREHADAAEGTAVVIGGDDGAAEALVMGDR